MRPSVIENARALNLIYQFWIHTEAVRSIGWLEKVLNTPSHHRVHHGSNSRYLDRNHGSILIVWDKLFGTFEREDEPVVYGLTKNIGSYNPAVIATHEWRDIARDVAGVDSGATGGASCCAGRGGPTSGTGPSPPPATPGWSRRRPHRWPPDRPSTPDEGTPASTIARTHRTHRALAETGRAISELTLDTTHRDQPRTPETPEPDGAGVSGVLRHHIGAQGGI